MHDNVICYNKDITTITNANCLSLFKNILTLLLKLLLIKETKALNYSNYSKTKQLIHVKKRHAHTNSIDNHTLQ